ncbi:hypothetical protein PUNSTDRAFT_129069 [Punctularia strigosozonata HHB-11173 SS5]|uniref:uncharacterized protein n=1 Tax=Punctularia strigosozonata (strain HHB-11173) TaxID=741275 RepID=UPI0004417D7F|nr:uncharacterized protein PUNSTDRAFT_129069 [Punctularia strigosozonata HHB-11173 SS5]EIN13380.1 hypothetical protein PUNSTDRAFT_129069 [Punctularia strigosozonata HHB-11173 SS5]
MASQPQNSGDEFVRPSTYSIEQSWGGHNNFMASYGLKPGEEEEASAIAEAFKDADEYEYHQSRDGDTGNHWSGEHVEQYDRYEDAGVYAGADPAREEEMVSDGLATDAASDAATYDPDEGGYGEYDPNEDSVFDDDAYDDPDQNDYEADEDY